MSAWLVVGYIVGILIGVCILYYIVRNLVVCGKNCFVDFVRVFCCQPNFGRNWDDDFGNDYTPRSRSPPSSRPSPLTSVPKPPALPPTRSKSSRTQRKAQTVAPARVTKPQKKKQSRAKKIGGAVGDESDTPNLSLLSTSAENVV